jgi:hypothetical protein
MKKNTRNKQKGKGKNSKEEIKHERTWMRLTVSSEDFTFFH